MRWTKLKPAIGWTCSVVVALELLLLGVGAWMVQLGDTPARFRPHAGPGPWFSLGLMAGSSFLIDRHGTILTAAHVVRDCRKVSVAGQGLRAVPARLLAHADNPFLDLAAIRIERSTPAFLSFADLSPPATGIGDGKAASAIGYPGSLDGATPQRDAVSRIVPERTAGDRSSQHWLLGLVGHLEHGNSGGPLLDGDGHVLGIVSRGAFGISGPVGGQVVATEGFATYGRYAVDWLRRTKLAVPAVPADATGSVDAAAAVVRVFCFGRGARSASDD